MNTELTLYLETGPIRVRMTKSGPSFNLVDLEAATGKTADRALHEQHSYIAPDLMEEIFDLSIPHLLASDAAHRMYRNTEALDPEDKHRWFFKAMMLLVLVNTFAMEDMKNAQNKAPCQ